MVKKSRIVESEDQDRVAWFKWEFLRRNAEYRADYQQLLERFGNWFDEKGYWWDRDHFPYEGEDWRFFCEAIAPEFGKLCQKWMIMQPLPPAWAFDNFGLHSYKQNRFATIPTTCTAGRVPSWNLKYEPPYDDRDDPRHARARFDEELGEIPDLPSASEMRHHDPEDVQYLRLELDMSKSIKEIRAEIDRELNWAKRRYESRYGRNRQHKTRPRRRLDDYSSYLRVWDLREEHLTFEALAKKLYPAEYDRLVKRTGRRLNPLVKRVRDYHRRASELIAGGYKQIE